MEKRNRPWLVQVRAAIRLMRLPGVGAATFRRLMRAFGSPTQALKASSQGLFPARGFDLSRPTPKRCNPELTDRACHAVEELANGEGGTWFGARDYPWRLRKIPEPPPVLFYRGRHRLLLPRHDDWAVAIVGARNATAAGREAARRIASGVIAAGGVVVSGLAAGIDGEAHQTALDEGGETIGVVATGIDVPYPPTAIDLWRRLGDEGLIVTEFFPGTPPVRTHFPTRNRIIAGLADAVVFVEGTASSGGLITLAKARAMKRPILALDGQGLMREGARYLLAKGHIEVLEPHPDALLEKLRGVREQTWSRRAACHGANRHRTGLPGSQNVPDLLQ